MTKFFALLIATLLFASTALAGGRSLADSVIFGQQVTILEVRPASPLLYGHPNFYEREQIWGSQRLEEDLRQLQDQRRTTIYASPAPEVRTHHKYQSDQSKRQRIQDLRSNLYRLQNRSQEVQVLHHRDGGTTVYIPPKKYHENPLRRLHKHRRQW